MADVFLSYAREDRHAAMLLAQVIRGHGWSVWSDQQIRVGTLFPRIIEREIDAAACVVVLWTRHSVEADWVRLEAWEGLSRNVLVSITMAADLRLPLEFRQVQTADLSGWPEDETGLAECIAAIRELVSSATATAASGRAAGLHARQSEAISVRRPAMPPSPPQVAPRARDVVPPVPTFSAHDVHHLQHHAVTSSPMAQYQPLLWSEAKNRNYFTVKHPAVLGFLMLIGVVLLLLLLFICLAVMQAQPKAMTQSPSQPGARVHLGARPHFSDNRLPREAP